MKRTSIFVHFVYFAVFSFCGFVRTESRCGNRTDRASPRTRAAIDAERGIDLALAAVFGNRADGAAVLASAATDACIGIYFVCHFLFSFFPLVEIRLAFPCGNDAIITFPNCKSKHKSAKK